MKTPLSVNILYHTDYTEGKEVYSRLYSLLCRDIDNPLSDGLDIPLFFTTGDDVAFHKSVSSTSERKVYVILIDINMFCSKEWKFRIDELMERKDENTLIVGVKLYKHSFSICPKLNDIQGIVADPDRDKEHINLLEENNWTRFTTQLFDSLLRFVSNKKDEALTVFISHAKSGNGGTGENRAKEIRSFLYSDTKINSFFDVHDILDGYDFKEQITRNAGGCLLLVILSDIYSSREWCRKEIIAAKNSNVPIVVVLDFEGQSDRLFPYIGNVPCIAYNNNWREIINLLLKTALNQTLQNLLLNQLSKKDTIVLPYSPEAFNLSNIGAKTKVVLYPEPPLGNEEVDVLNGICKSIKRKIEFCTPMSYNIGDLNGISVGISIAKSSDLETKGIGEQIIKDLTIEITRHILKANGRMVYGGDLRKDGYTELFRDLSYQYGQREDPKGSEIYIKDYLSWPLFNDITLDQKAEYIKSRIELINAEVGEEVNEDEKSIFVWPTTLSYQLKWASSLRKMRKQIIEATQVRVAVGGKTTGFSGYMAGIAEEFILAAKKGQPVFLLGGFGGATAQLCRILEYEHVTSEELKELAMSDQNYKRLFEYCVANSIEVDYNYLDTLSIESLNNGLSEPENRTLFHSVDILEIVHLVLKGLTKLANPKK